MAMRMRAHSKHVLAMFAMGITCLPRVARITARRLSARRLPSFLLALLGCTSAALTLSQRAYALEGAGRISRWEEATQVGRLLLLRGAWRSSASATRAISAHACCCLTWQNRGNHQSIRETRHAMHMRLLVYLS